MSSPATAALKQINRLDAKNIVEKDFTDAEELKQVYGETHAEIIRAGNAGIVANQELILALGKMRAILSQRGKEKLKKQAGIKWTGWEHYFREYKKKYGLKDCLRTVISKIDELAGKKLCTECKKAGGHLPSCSRHPEPIPHFNKADRRALIEGNHKAVEIVTALEAGRDPKEEVVAFKAVMNAKLLDDILTVADGEEAAKASKEFSWEELENRLSALLPISCDGVEHVFVTAMGTAILKVRNQDGVDFSRLNQMVYDCQRLSARFALYAKKLDRKIEELSATAIAKEDKDIEANLPFHKFPAPSRSENQYKSRGHEVYYYDETGKKVLHSKVSSNTEAVALAKSLNELNNVPEKSVAN